MSVSTVRNYVRSIHEKLHVHSKGEAVASVTHDHALPRRAGRRYHHGHLEESIMPIARSFTRRELAASMAALAVASIAHPLGARQADAEKAVLQAIAQVNDAFQRGDVKAYDALTTADFIRVGGDGRMFAKAAWLKNTVPITGAPRRPGSFDETSVRVYGDAALTTYRNTPVRADGKPGAVGYLTRVFEKQGAQWRLAFAQSTDLQHPAPPTTPDPPALPAWSASTPLEKEALAAFQSIQKANRDRDVAAWERLSAPDHLIITAEGRKVTRAERVAALKAPPAANAPPPAADSELRLVLTGGSLAVASWRAGQVRQLKVLAKRGTGWQQVLQQSSPVVARQP